jgi:hypothetical protein
LTPIQSISFQFDRALERQTPADEAPFGMIKINGMKRENGKKVRSKSLRH